MKKRKQILIGAGTIFIVWILNMAVLGEAFIFCDFMYSVIIYIQNIFRAMLPVAVTIICVIGFVKNLKYLSLSAYIMFLAPILIMKLCELFSDDSNILSWIFAFTIGMLLYPFMPYMYSVIEPLSDAYWYGWGMIFVKALFIVLSISSLVLLIITFINNKKAVGDKNTENTDCVDSNTQSNFPSSPPYK